MDRSQHLAWCKQRALEYLPHDPHNAIASMASDLGKHPDTARSAQLVALVMHDADRPDRVRDWVNGFN